MRRPLLSALGKKSKRKNSTSFTGSETRSYNRDLRQQIPIIALTANALRGMRELYLEKGFQDYLSKPISPEALDEIITKYLGDGGTGKNRDEELGIRNKARLVEHSYQVDIPHSSFLISNSSPLPISSTSATGQAEPFSRGF